MNPYLKNVAPHERKRLLRREAEQRESGDWGEFESLRFKPGTFGKFGWAFAVQTAYRNNVFTVLHHEAGAGVIHLAVSSLSGIRPTWHEMQRIKNLLAGEQKMAIEIYPPADKVVDGADMFHIWVLRESLNIGLR